MPRHRRIRKEDIGDPSNFVHVHHVGFGPKSSNTPTQQSFDSGGDPDSAFVAEENTATDTGFVENEEMSYNVVRRTKGSRTSMIPRHHRSTTTCIFPPQAVARGSVASIKTRKDSIDSPESSSDNRTSLKPTFGSLLNLSFLPLGLGKSSAKSPSIGKNKRSSLLNLTATNLFAGPKGNYEENRESVHMTSYIRRRSFSNSNDGNNDNPSPNLAQNVTSESENEKLQLKPQPGFSSSVSPRIALAKLGRSKSSMSEFTKRPKLRLKIVPPVVPPPVPPEVVIKNPAETLPSPPPSPIPSPPPSPVPNTPSSAQVVALRKSLKSLHRPRIIPLPSTSSVESVDPSSPQYLTPAGGCSPQPNESSFPLLSPTLPPACTPFYSSARGSPSSTPPVWPLQPVWPTTLSISRKELEATIPEIPSPCKEEMETSENEYGPVLSIVESFISEEQDRTAEPNACKPLDVDMSTLHPRHSLAVTPTNIEVITSVLQESIEYKHWPRIAEKLFHSIQETPSSNHTASILSTDEKDIYSCMLRKTLELWLEKAGNDAIIENLVAILKEENHSQATESLQEIFGELKM